MAKGIPGSRAYRSDATPFTEAQRRDVSALLSAAEKLSASSYPLDEKHVRFLRDMRRARYATLRQLAYLEYIRSAVARRAFWSGGGSYSSAEEPPPQAARSNVSWRQVLGASHNATLEEVKKLYWKLAKANHPDVGGDVEMMKRINSAMMQARRELLR